MGQIRLIILVSLFLVASSGLAQETSWSSALYDLATLTITDSGAFYNKFYTSTSKKDEFVKQKVSEFSNLCQQMKLRKIPAQEQLLRQAWRRHLREVVEAKALDDPAFARQITQNRSLNLAQAGDLDRAIAQHLADTVPKAMKPLKTREELYAWSLYSFSNQLVRAMLTIYPLPEKRLCQHDKLLCKRFTDLRNCFYGLRVEASRRLQARRSHWQILSDTVHPRSQEHLYSHWSLQIQHQPQDDSRPQVEVSEGPNNQNAEKSGPQAN